MRHSPAKTRIIAAVLLAGVLPLPASLAAHLIIGDAKHVQEPLHEGLELAGACIVLVVGMLLLLRLRHENASPHLLWVVAALVAMGIVDGMHSFLPTGVAFSWTRHGATLVGGALFALVWLPLPAVVVRRKQHFIFLVAVLAIAGSLAILRWPERLPAPWVAGNYSRLVIATNALGGLGFLTAALFFIRRYLREPQTEDLVFASQTLLFSTASLYFGFSHVWAADWWVWHGARLLAYVIVLVAAHKTVVALYQHIARHAKGLETANAALRVEMDERERAKAALKDSENKFRSMAETSPLAIYMSTGIEQKAHYINPKFVQLFGYTIEDVPTVGQWWPRAYPDEKYRQQIIEEWQDKVKRAIETNTPIEPLDVTVTCKDGSTKNVIWGFTSLGDTNYAYGLDITERKRAEDAQRKALEELSRTNDELTRFSYLVSHDLRSPVVTIKAFLAYLEEDVATQDAERMGKDLGYIRTAADKMSQLLDELLNLSRVGRKVNPPEEVPLQVVVKEAMDMVAGQIAERGVQVQVTEEPILLYGDRPRLVEIFQNLLDNACKFMGDQTAPRVEIGAELAGDEPLLFVRDNGIGIDPRHHPKIFGLFEKLDPRAEGTGLGLALVRRMVEVHGGKIWVESAGPGMGTTFRFTLDGTKRVST